MRYKHLEAAAMTKTLLAVLLVVAPGLLAQETPASQARPEEAAPARTQTQAMPAPQLGHPLDPADVDVLTGKTKAAASTGYPLDPLSYECGSKGGYPANVAPWRTPRFAGFGPASTRFGPLLFGRMRSGSFFFIGNSPFFSPPFFFFTGRSGTGNSFLFGPTRSGFFFRR